MVTVEHLTKYYGDHLAVDDLSFEIPDGHVYGFLGPNGAGKSTTMNILTGCLSATEGRVLIGGYDIFEEPLEAKRLIGYLPEQPPLYVNESPIDYLKFVGRAKGLRGEELDYQIEKAIAETGIETVKNRRIATLSKGYKQRVGIAQALLGDPELIILDEPTVGLDPLQILGIRELIKSLGEDHTVIFSSHILSEVQTVCDEILMIAKGRLVAFDTPENLEKNLMAPNEITVLAETSPEDMEKLCAGIPEVSDFSLSEAEAPYVRARLKTALPDIYDLSRSVFRAFAAADLPLLEMNLKKANLEDIFLELADAAGDIGKDGEEESGNSASEGASEAGTPDETELPEENAGDSPADEEKEEQA